MSRAAKLTTGMTGMAVAQYPHRTLGGLYNKILRVLEQMPEQAAYRKHTYQIVAERAAVLKSTDKIEVAERQIGCGQAEELIVQAENELMLARKMLEWKPWEPLISQPPKGQWNWPPIN